MTQQKQFCTFYLDDLLFGIDVLKVQEIILPQEMTKIPLAPSAVRGLINLRGQVVTAIDLRTWLGIDPIEPRHASMNVVIRTDEEIVSFLVDRIGDVLEPDEGTFERSPETLDQNIRELLDGIYKLENQLLLVMDAERTLELFVERFCSRHQAILE